MRILLKTLFASWQRGTSTLDESSLENNAEKTRELISRNPLPDSEKRITLTPVGE